jgi:hypothetical protein
MMMLLQAKRQGAGEAASKLPHSFEHLQQYRLMKSSAELA